MMSQNKFKLSKLKLSVAAAFLTLTTGCATTSINESRKSAIEDRAEAKEILTQGKRLTPKSSTVSVVDDLYIVGKSFRMSDRDILPDFFNENIIFNQIEPVSFQEVIGNISLSSSTRIEMSDDAMQHLVLLSESDSEGEDSSSSDSVESVNERADFAGIGVPGSKLKFSLDFDGSLSGLLDHITSKAGLFWKFKGSKVLIFRHETKQYIFDGDTSSFEFAATMSTSKSGGEKGNTGSQETNRSGQTAQVNMKTGNSFADVLNSLESMRSTFGKISASAQQGVITITDTPLVHDKVGEYIEQMNGIVNKRIAIKTKIIEISLDDTADLGLDFTPVYKKAGKYTLGLTGQFGDITKGGVSMGIIDNSSRFKGSKSMINALATVADVSIKTSTMHRTKNGKSIPIQVATENAYLAETTPVLNDEGKLTGVKLTPGTVVTGITMSITPRINSEGDIDMKFFSDMSTLDEIRSISAGEGASKSSIELPKKSFKKFMENVSIDSGKTIMIAGFERTEDKSSISSIAGENAWALGGSKKGGKRKVMTIIMLTPYIMAK